MAQSQTFLVFAQATGGTGATGATGMAWVGGHCYDSYGGGAISPTPTFTEIAQGFYSFQVTVQNGVVGIVDMTTAASAGRYAPIMVDAGTPNFKVFTHD